MINHRSWLHILRCGFAAAALLSGAALHASTISGVATPPIVEAINSKQPAVVAMLIKQGADIHLVDENKFDLLEMAVMSNQVDVLKMLAQAGDDPKERIIQGGTLLHLAATENRPDMIAALIELGVDPNRRDQYGYSPLLIAAGGGHVDSARMLLDHGAWTYPIGASGDTALTAAKKHISDPALAASMIQLLVQHGASASGEGRPVDEAYLDAVGRGDLSAVKAALAKGADINARRHFSMEKPLCEAAKLAARYPEVLAYLIDHGLDINATDSFGYTALYIASGRAGNLESIKLLVSHGADINAISTTRQTPLSNAVNMNQPGAVALLLELGANPNVPGVSGTNLLAMAREPHHSALLAPMLEKAGTKEDPPGTPQPCNLSAKPLQPCALAFYVRNSNDDGVRRALDDGISINVHGPHEEPLLILALLLPKSKSELLPVLQNDRTFSGIVERKLKIAHYLIDRGIDVTAIDDKGLTALHAAARDPRLADFIAILIRKGARPDAQSNDNHATPLIYAVEARNSVGAEQLLANGAAPNLPMVRGISPLLAACELGDDAMATLLLQHGARVDVATDTGMTPLKAAVIKSENDIVALLLKAGANPDYDGGYSPSPRMIAVGKDASIQALFTPR